MNLDENASRIGKKKPVEDEVLQIMRKTLILKREKESGKIAKRNQGRKEVTRWCHSKVGET